MYQAKVKRNAVTLDNELRVRAATAVAKDPAKRTVDDVRSLLLVAHGLELREVKAIKGASSARPVDKMRRA